MLRRLFDLLVGTGLLVVAAPVMGAIAIALWLEGGGPVLCRSPRVGRGGRTFELLRFRTACAASPLDGEPQLTPMGRLIHEYSLDDLPNLLNVIRGDLSMVGPRPTEPEWIDPSDPGWERILAERPGMISPAILHLAAAYNSSSLAVKHVIEIEYLEERTLSSDIELLKHAWRALIASRGNLLMRGCPGDKRVQRRLR